MEISYKKLWILLIEKEISPATLRKDLNIATGTMTKLRRNEEVALSVLLRICEYLGCNIGDICDAVKIEKRGSVGSIMFCVNCGQEISENTKFCNVCGTKIVKDSAEERKTVYDGEIHKCPNCGDIIDAYETVCEACGYELRGRKATSVVHELALKLESIDDSEKKEELIRTFYIPNTKEDIYEFFILATSNIKAGSADSNVWFAKLEQAYQKAELSFGGTKEFERFSNLYKKIQMTRKVNATLRFLSKLLKLKVIWIIVAVIFSCVALFGPYGLLGSVERKHDEHIEYLETLVVEVEMLIEEGDYDGARIKASQIVDDTNWSTESEKKWDGVRKELLELIKKRRKMQRKSNLCIVERYRQVVNCWEYLLWHFALTVGKNLQMERVFVRTVERR